MTELDWRVQDDPAATVQALASHRLLPVAGLLAKRGLLRADLVPLASRLVQQAGEAERRRVAIENEVLRSMAAAGVETLVLKGALLGRTVYPTPEARIRTDTDLLVASNRVDDAYAALRSIGFSPSYEAQGGPPMTQAQWIRRGESPVHAVDLHWDLSNRPLLKERFMFEALFSRAIELHNCSRPVAGLCPEDALLHACAHYFGHHRYEFRPDQWLLDMDLLWRGLYDGGPGRVADAAISMGIASLVAAGMRLSVERFKTPVPSDWLTRLEQASRRESARRLTRPPRFRALEIFRSASEERDWVAGIRNLRGTFFPPAAYMFRKYPGVSRWALPWLYVRRMLDGFSK